MQPKNTCACTLECMDARIQDAVKYTTQKEAHAGLVDVITQAGMVRVLAENKNKVLINNFREELTISVKKHGTSCVSIAAHEDCAANPVSKEEQIEHLKQAKKTVESWGLDVKIILLWLPETEDWKTVELVD